MKRRIFPITYLRQKHKFIQEHTGGKVMLQSDLMTT